MLRELRTRGAFTAEPQDGSPAIPKVIVQYWHDAAPPCDVAACMQSWQICPGFTYRVFDDDAARAYIRGLADRRALEAYDLCLHPAMKSDLFRLCFALREGGFYADADEVCVGLLDHSLLCADLVLIQERHGAIWNGFFGATPSHPVIAAALKHAVDNIVTRQSGNIWSISGPGVLSRAFSRFGSASEIQTYCQ
jgi:mannosyltransferase OCH1-like enzyme